MTSPAPDRSRDRRIEDVTNLLVVHPAAHRLLATALRWRVSANAVSVAGLACGTAAAACFYNWQNAWLATLGFGLGVAWLIADGLDGMVARATGTTSAVGRMLDGLCDHGVFILIYVALATSLGTSQGWYLAFGAGFAHALQSSLYEAERARFHRRLRGDFASSPAPSRFGLVRVYDTVAGAVDQWANPFDRRALAASRAPGDAALLGARYANAAVPAMRFMALLSANVRVIAVYVACLCHDVQYFWWFEIIPLSLVSVVATTWHRQIERRVVHDIAIMPALGDRS